LSKVALDRHRILMLKNKIYKYLLTEIVKNFLTILLTFTAVAWTVKAVNFLDLMIADGYSANIYFKYSLLNISSVATRFIPLSFLLSLIIAITKFERQQELLILWTAGLNKIKITNILFLIGFLIALFQILLSLIVNPYLLYKSRMLLRDTEFKQVNSVLKSNDFSDVFEGVTFFIEDKNSNNELFNIFIKDNSGSLNSIINEVESSNNTTIFAERGFVSDNKLVLFKGIIQTLNHEKKLKNINFKTTELSLKNLATRTIMTPKIQETSSYELFICLNFNSSYQNCIFKNNRKDVIEALSRRIGMTLYIPLVALIASFLLIHKKEKKYNFLKKYIVFSCAFLILVFAETTLRYSGFSLINFAIYFFTPIIFLFVLYLLLVKKMIFERTI